MRLCLIADIHGNADALEAVLGDIAGESFDAHLALGDHLSGPLQAARTADMLIGSDWLCLAGNHDRALVTHRAEEMGPSDLAAYGELSARHIDWLRHLPSTLRLDGVFACHGTPTNDHGYWLEDVVAERMVLAERHTVEARRLGVPDTATLAVCGHTHVPRLVTLGGLDIVNPGSVGLPGYTDDVPFHVMQTGSPHARYAVAEKMRAGWRVGLRSVPYDTTNVVRLARERERPDWAAALEAGWIV